MAAIGQIQNSSIADFGPPVANLTMNGYRLIDIADPIDDTDAVSKKYVDIPMEALQADLAGHEDRIHALETNPPTSMDTQA